VGAIPGTVDQIQAPGKASDGWDGEQGEKQGSGKQEEAGEGCEHVDIAVESEMMDEK